MAIIRGGKRHRHAVRHWELLGARRPLLAQLRPALRHPPRRDEVLKLTTVFYLHKNNDILTLSVERSINRSWALTSWAAENGSGAGSLFYGSLAEFENVGIGRDVFNFNFNFMAEEEEDYIMFSVLPFPGSPARVFSGLRLESDGDIVDVDKSMILARPDSAAVGLRAWIGFALAATVLDLMLVVI
ncbi:hypothetical protein SASPL_149186 [Salvia splendens]|uniref:Uncharacterized protein n=1 Tax=Salvia splendens TaxID=180675 RepID=A0A8X8WAP7_SALSN|nr:hypothetical protein SASPL_149186 [Salvia splendens]